MSAGTERRVAALESAGAAAIDFILILRHVITPGVPPGEATQARMLGQHFEREPTESEPDFIARLRSYAMKNRRPDQFRVQVLLGEADLDLQCSQRARSAKTKDCKTAHGRPHGR